MSSSAPSLSKSRMRPPRRRSSREKLLSLKWGTGVNFKRFLSSPFLLDLRLIPSFLHGAFSSCSFSEKASLVQHSVFVSMLKLEGSVDSEHSVSSFISLFMSFAIFFSDQRLGVILVATLNLLALLGAWRMTSSASEKDSLAVLSCSSFSRLRRIAVPQYPAGIFIFACGCCKAAISRDSVSEPSKSDKAPSFMLCEVVETLMSFKFFRGVSG